MGRATWIAAALAACVACGGKKESRPLGEQPAPPVVARAPQDAAPVTPTPGPAAGGYAEDAAMARWVLVEAWGDEKPRARYAAIDLGDGAAARPVVTELGEHAALPYRDWEGHFRTVAAHQGPRWLRATSTGGEAPRFAVELGSAAEPKKAPRVIDLGEREPTALHLTGEILYVGAGQEVGWVDLAAQQPAFATLVQRDLRGEKAYDLFVRLGDRLVAIDDIVRPMMADWFALDAAARATRIGDWALPGVINGHYAHGALRARGGGTFTLYLIAPYGIMSGDGHNLVAVPIEKDRLVFEDGLVLQNAAGGATPVLEEQVSRDSGAVQSLVAGKVFTEWSGLAVDAANETLLVAAGERGLLVLPADLAHDTRADVVSLGGACHDVVARGGRLLALVGAGAGSELVTLERGAKGYAAGARVRLARAYRRILD